MMEVGEKEYILVTGAAGFIGRDVLARLLDRGWRVKAMVRRTPSPPFPSHDKLEAVRADMRDADSLRKAIANVAVVVHLAAAKSDEPESYDVNVGGAKRLIEACNAAGCTRIINISTQSAKIPRKGTYAQTKNEADKIFHCSGLQVTTFLPSIVYGEQRSGVFGTVLQCVQRLPVVPVLGNGKWVSAPIYVSDVSGAIISSIENDNTASKMYDLGGPDVISFDALIDKICAELGIKRRKLHIPFTVALLAAKAAGRLLSKPPITVSNVLGSNQDTNIDIEPARRDFAFDPLDLDTGLKVVLSKSLIPRTLNSSRCTLPRSSSNDEATLKAECVLNARYLMDCEPPQELIDRYVEANRILFGKEIEGRVEPELAFIHRNPHALPFIDAAAGLLRPQSIVRRKLFLTAAILEATPTYADFFLKRPEPVLKLLCSLVWQVAHSLVKVAIGVPLFIWARRG